MKRFTTCTGHDTIGDGWPQTDHNQEKCPDFFFRTNFVIIIPADVKSITVAIE